MAKIFKNADPAKMARLLKEGEVCVYPTETSYAIGCMAYDELALERLYEIKGRDAAKRLPLIAADMEMIKEIAPNATRFQTEMMKLFFPAPLTFVLKAADGLPRQITDDSNNAAVRISSCETARALSDAVGGPIVSTSANLSGFPPALDIFEAVKYFDKFDVAFYIDGGRLPGGASTIIRIDRLNRIRILRKGAVGEEEIAAAKPKALENAKRSIDKRGRKRK